MVDTAMEEPVGDGKLVELTYKVIDRKTQSVLTEVEYPIGYVHGVNEILAPQVTAEIEGKLPGDVIEVPIDCNNLFGPRDENLVFTDHIDNVPEEYREVGMSILMENDCGFSVEEVAVSWAYQRSRARVPAGFIGLVAMRRMTVVSLTSIGMAVAATSWRGSKTTSPLW